MEKTLAREIYKRMEIGKAYTTSDLFELIGDDYYKMIPMNQHPGQPDGMPVNKMISSEMWKVVKSGYATTCTEEENLANVRGLRYGTTPKSFTTYKFRYWTRIR